MNNKLKTQAVEQLFQAILSLKDLDEAYDLACSFEAKEQRDFIPVTEI